MDLNVFTPATNIVEPYYSDTGNKANALVSQNEVIETIPGIVRQDLNIDVLIEKPFILEEGIFTAADGFATIKIFDLNSDLFRLNPASNFIATLIMSLTFDVEVWLSCPGTQFCTGRLAIAYDPAINGANGTSQVIAGTFNTFTLPRSLREAMNYFTALKGQIFSPCEESNEPRLRIDLPRHVSYNNTGAYSGAQPLGAIIYGVAVPLNFGSGINNISYTLWAKFINTKWTLWKR